MSEHKHNESGHSDHGHSTKQSGAGWGYLIMIPIIFVGFLIIKSLLSSGDTKSKETKDNNKNKTEQTQSYGPKPIRVTYGPGYGDIVYLPSGYDYYFEGATEPYCYSNSDGLENCGEKGEDATGTFGNSPSNKKLRFKSRNNKYGSLDIILIKQKNYENNI